MPSPFLISKALDIRPTALGKCTFSTLKGLLVIAGIAAIGWSIWTGLIQPHTKWRVASTIQKAEKIENITHEAKKRHHIELFWGAIKIW